MSKVTDLASAVSSVPPGSHIALSGFATSRSPMAFAHEVIRQGIKNLTVSQCVACMAADLLVGAGAVERVINGGGSRGRSGQHFCIVRAHEAGTLKKEELSSLSMTFRYLAGALGLPFIPIRSLRGSDILVELEEAENPVARLVEDPFSGDEFDLYEVAVFVGIQDENIGDRAVQQEKPVHQSVGARRGFIQLTQRLDGDGEVRNGIEVSGVYGKRCGCQEQ